MKKNLVYMTQARGFSLIEMAMVLMIIALVLGGLLPTLSSQIEQRQVSETRKQLDEIQQALIGYAVANGRLPCPASNTSNGLESPLGGGNCSNFYNGYLPAATLGLNGAVSSQGLILDAWGNPIRYAVSKWSSTTPNVPYVFTATSGAGMSQVGIAGLTPNLLVCSTAPANNASSCTTGTALTPNNTPAIIFSTGKNGSGTGADESNNSTNNNNAIFVSHLPAPSSSSNGEFDDIVVWLSTSVLVNRMVAAGQLP